MVRTCSARRKISRSRGSCGSSGALRLQSLPGLKVQADLGVGRKTLQRIAANMNVQPVKQSPDPLQSLVDGPLLVGIRHTVTTPKRVIRLSNK